MVSEKRATVPCPDCGGQAECYYCRVQEGIVLWDVYTRWCPRCGKRKTEKRQAGYQIASVAYPQPTVCPFCGKSAAEHPKGVSLGGVCRALQEQSGEGGPLSSPGKASIPPN